jgi:hypothetical protein
VNPTMVGHPRNIAAILEWVSAKRPDCLDSFTRMFSINDPVGHNEALILLTLIGFEAGRAFQKRFPNVTSGIGYATVETKPVRRSTVKSKGRSTNESIKSSQRNRVL